MTGRAIIARGTPVLLPAPLALLPNYPPLAEIERRFLASLRFGSPRTAGTYRDGLLRWSHFLAAAGIDVGVETAEVLPDDVLEHFFGWLADAGYGRATVETYLGGVKAFWRFATAKRFVPPRFSYDAMRGGLGLILGKHKVRTARIDRGLVRILPYVDGLALPDPAERHGAALLELLRDRALLHVLFYSGMRRAELSSLNRSDVQDGYASSALIVGKGDRERNVFLGPDGQAAVRVYLEARSDNLRPLWLRHDNHRGRPGLNGEHWRLSNQSVWGIVKHYAAAVGVEGTTHHFRHLKATTLLERGAALEQVQDVLGHADPSITKSIYIHASPARLRDVVEQYSARAADLVAELEPGRSQHQYG